ncbi:MAG: hypothetical protein EXR60_01215 [Dehalococcoidia bacterium]|nr:hypothetical protein [Dehalococcoidia bacterium]
MARLDGQLTGLAGEFFVAAELLRRGLQVSVTFGNAKAIDLFANEPLTNRTFTIQVKALRRKTYFPISADKIRKAHVYVFVLLNKPPTPPEYFIVPGNDLADHADKFGKWFKDYKKFPGIHPKDLEEYRDGWELFMGDGPR